MARLPSRPSTRLATAPGKRNYAAAVFHEVAPRYDIITRVLSFGLDPRWKRLVVARLGPEVRRQDFAALDLACGTGDLTRLVARAGAASVIGVDFTPGMVSRAVRLGLPPGVSYLTADMQTTGLPAASADLVTGGYALRNAPDLTSALREIKRVLKPGGRGLFLDFCHNPGPGGRLQLRLLYLWGALWGLLLHRDPEVYGYIARSLAGFPIAAELEKQLLATGFTRVRTRRLLLGFMALVSCRVPG